jgi:uncharacterized small protein (DUF1192 family)
VTGLAAGAAVTSAWFTSVVSLIIGAGGAGGIAALVKVKPERGRIVIDAAQGAVVVQSGVMADLRAELDRLRAELEESRADRDAEVARLRAEVLELRSGRDAEVAQLRAEVARLRAETAVTATRVTRVEQAADDGGTP